MHVYDCREVRESGTSAGGWGGKLQDECVCEHRNSGKIGVGVYMCVCTSTRRSWKRVWDVCMQRQKGWERAQGMCMHVHREAREGIIWNQWHSLKMATMEGMTLHIYLQHNNKTYIVQTPPLLPSVSSHLKTALKWISLKKTLLLPVLMIIWI